MCCNLGFKRSSFHTPSLKQRHDSEDDQVQLKVDGPGLISASFHRSIHLLHPGLHGELRVAPWTRDQSKEILIEEDTGL